MAGPADKERRGGRRQRNSPNKAPLGEINEAALVKLLKVLAPGAAANRRDLALAIVVRGIEIYRDSAQNRRPLAGTVQENRRALKRFNKGKTETGIPPFNSIVSAGGFVYGASREGIVQILDVPQEPVLDAFGGLEKAISEPLSILASVRQFVLGMKNINPNLTCNPIVGIDERGRNRTFGDHLLDEIARPIDCEADLAGFVYLSLTRALSLDVSMTWFESEPEKIRKGWNFGQLLRLAANEAGAEIPSSRDAMEGLMKRGRGSAMEMLEPAITFSDGRTLSSFDIESRTMSALAGEPPPFA